MKKLILALAAAVTLGGGLAATTAGAQTRERPVVRTTTTAEPVQRERVVRTRTVVTHRHSEYNRRWHRDYDRGRHYGWRNHRRTCTTVWRHHQRIRTCRSW